MTDTSRQAVIVSAARTPIGKFLGGLAPLTAQELGAVAIRAAVQRAGIDIQAIEEVIMGNVIQGGVGQAPGRQAAMKAGIPATVSALTIAFVTSTRPLGKAAFQPRQTPSTSSRVRHTVPNAGKSHSHSWAYCAAAPSTSRALNRS